MMKPVKFKDRLYEIREIVSKKAALDVRFKVRYGIYLSAVIHLKSQVEICAWYKIRRL